MLRDAQVGDLKYQHLMFICPGCKQFGGTGLHVLPVNTDVTTSWTYDGNVEAPTLSPSILTTSGREQEQVCHSFLIEGVFAYLPDSTHSLKQAPMENLPDWLIDEE